MYDISNNSAPQNISRLFRKSNLINPYKTRSSASGNFDIQYSRLKSDFLRISRIGRQSRKIDFSFISPKHTFG